MNNVFANSFVCFVVIFLFYNLSDAKSYAWLTDNDKKIYKFDSTANTIISTLDMSQSIKTSSLIEDKNSAMVFDHSSNLLFVIYDLPGRFNGQGIKILDTKAFVLIKDLGIISDRSDGDLPRLIVPPYLDKFYVIWWDKTQKQQGKNGLTYSVYSKATMNKLSDISGEVNVNLPYMYSSDGSLIYNFNVNSNEIKIFDSLTLKLVDVRSIANIWGSPLADKHDDYYFKSKVLLSENIKVKDTDPNNVSYFVYDIDTNKITKKISVREPGEEIITPDGSKLIINELGYEYGGSSITGTIHINKIHIYDFSTGSKLKLIDLNGCYKNIAIMFVAQDGSKLFLSALDKSNNKNVILSIDLMSPSVTYGIIDINATYLFTSE